MKKSRSNLWRSLLIGVGLLFPTSAQAWSNHSLGSYPALSALPEVKDAQPVKVESIEQFLAAEQEGLAKLLREEEAWARANVPNYPARPDGLEFKAGGPAEDLRVRFLRAIRVNPTIKLALFVQPLPGTDVAGKPTIHRDGLSILPSDAVTSANVYLELKPGDQVTPLEVAATAADEPDYGLDIGLFEDNATEWGKAYGFGTQPFGNPKLVYGSQAPFHIGYYHEAGIVYSLAGFVKRTWPEVRLHLYQSLARYAFKSGHPYWGWRFVGWGLHYIQDLTQPYHSTLLPGVSVGRMLWINTIAMLGASKKKDEAVQLVTNRHLALENYQYFSVRSAQLEHRQDDPVLMAHGNTQKDPDYGVYGDSYPRQVLTKESNGRADKTDEALEKYLPARLVSDPAYIFEQTEPDINVLEVVKKGGGEGKTAMDSLMVDLLESFGAHSRNYVRAALAP